eukprot:6790849-Pyramimonas_sp.AAC.1
MFLASVPLVALMGWSLVSGTLQVLPFARHGGRGWWRVGAMYILPRVFLARLREGHPDQTGR